MSSVAAAMPSGSAEMPSTDVRWTVPDSVICGTTFNVNAASLNAVVTVLFETV